MTSYEDEDVEYLVEDDSDQLSYSNNESESSSIEEADKELVNFDVGFSDIRSNRDHKPEFEVEFQVLSMQDILSRQAQEISQVSSILSLPEGRITTLLRHFRWNKDKLLDAFVENADKVLIDAGLTLEDLNGSASLEVKKEFKVAPKGFTCPICCDDDWKNMRTFSLACTHCFCTSCYERYVTQKIMEEGEVRRINCPGAKCRLALDEGQVQLLVKQRVFEKYKRLLYRAFVDDIEYLKWCPSPNCDNTIECHVPNTALSRIVPTVQCSCSIRFCFGCGRPDHLPIICSLLKKWLQKCQDDSETSHWISINTKECTKCKTTIEKNGGCNHMTCRKCRHEFCWVCMGSWTEHSSGSYYNCNRFNEKDKSTANDSISKTRLALERYLHYYNRYANHERSGKLEQELIAKSEKKMEEIQHSTDLSWIEVQFFKGGVETLVRARTTLQYTYAFAYYLVRTNFTEIFEDNQRDLEVAVEQLSEMLEKPIIIEKIPELRQAVLDKTVYVASRRAILLRDVAKGLNEDKWTFNKEL